MLQCMISAGLSLSLSWYCFNMQDSVFDLSSVLCRLNTLASGTDHMKKDRLGSKMPAEMEGLR